MIRIVLDSYERTKHGVSSKSAYNIMVITHRHNVECVGIDLIHSRPWRQENLTLKAAGPTTDHNQARRIGQEQLVTRTKGS